MKVAVSHWSSLVTGKAAGRCSCGRVPDCGGFGASAREGLRCRTQTRYPSRCSGWAGAMIHILLGPLLLSVHVLSQNDFNLADAVDDSRKLATSTVPPGKPRHPAAGGTGDDFNLADALDPKNDISVQNNKKKAGGAFSDSDLVEVSKDDSYNPDGGKGGRSKGDSSPTNQHDEGTGASGEVVTITGIISAAAMVLVGGIGSYISYQKKKFCFSLQQSLNVDLMKTENPEAVVATEPHAQQTLLEPANTEPPAKGNVV
ncbi:CD99 antigen-like protein 2 [Nothobranchius furzeri]